MQTLQEIRGLLESYGLAPQKRFGQNFLIDQNLLGKIVELADIDAGQTILEVGPGTGSLTEELIERAGRVVAVEIDSGFHRLLSERLAGREKLVLLHRDILVGKHRLDGEALSALGARANLVSNLPYNVATPLVVQCLVSSWQSLGVPGAATPPGLAEPAQCVRFDRLTFTVQQEVAERLVAPPGSGAYGPASVIVALLGRCRFGPVVPNTAFWPRPRVTSRVVRIDFDEQQARLLVDIHATKAMVATAFGQRRKQIGSVIHRKNAAFEPEDFAAALEAAGIDRTVRAEQVAPEQFRQAGNSLTGKLRARPFGEEAAIED